jgi:cytochrome c553
MMVRDQGALRLDNPWPRIGWISCIAILFIASVLAFVVLSRYQLNEEPLDLWSAICRGLGITSDTAPAASPRPPLRRATDLAWTPATLEQIRAGDATRGSFVAFNCTACHEGSAANPAHLIPTLGGMEVEAIFKQLADYRSGKRNWGVMNAIAKALSVQDAADVAAYFAERPGRLQANSGERFPQGGRGFRQSDIGARLVFAGDPQRGIAPCSSCHGPGGYKIGAPTLSGQYPAYIDRQVAAFAQGIRHNDIFEQMRAIARQLTPEEMQAVAAFYGSQRPKRQRAIDHAGGELAEPVAGRGAEIDGPTSHWQLLERRHR